MATDDHSAAGAQLTLDRRLDLAAAGALRLAFLDRRGQPVSVDAGGVAHLGALALQVLMAAAAHWRQAGIALTFAARSAAFDAALSTFAVPIVELESRGSACA